jgi:hypothetical protein
LESAYHVDADVVQEYVNNIQVVDKIMQDVENMIKEYYQDERTAFLFTQVHFIDEKEELLADSLLIQRRSWDEQYRQSRRRA